jgi:hypothetical protein
MSPTRGTEALRSTRRSPRVSRCALVVLAVAAVLLAPVRASGAAASVRADDAHQLVAATPSAAGHHHLGIAHGLRNLTDGRGRTGTPLGTMPTAALVTAALLTLLALARRGAATARRSRAAFSRRAPPTPFAIG